MTVAPATVLVVDDSPENRYAIRRYLSGAEFDVWEAETGAQGLQMAVRDPDLILLDVHLPDINGFDVCRRLKEDERTRHIPVLQRSQSHVDDAARVHGLESGADAYLTEPVDPSVLVATARALLRVRRAENRLRRLNQVGVQLATALTRGDVLQSVSVAVNAEIGRDPTFFLYDESRRWLRETPGEDVAAELAFDADDPAAEVARTGEPRFDERQGIAPLVAYGNRLGALTVPVTLSESEREILLALSTQCAQALERAGLYEYQHHVATTLQEGLLPKSLPEIAGAELAARYNAGARAMDVGGDFYDVFPRGEDWVMVIGDVCGRGAEAAALTGLARHTIRAQAQHLEHPSEILRALHDAIVAEVGRDSARFVTAGCVLLGRDGAVRASFAGHPPGLIARAAGEVEELATTGQLLGLLQDLRLSDVEAKLEPGDALVLYTDGVIEARRERELFGEERLTALVRDVGPRGLDADAIADAIREATVAFAGSTDDDTAILVLRRTVP